MKVQASIREVYEDQAQLNLRLKDEVDKRINGFRNNRWHYESRIKELISFAMKIETGRVQTPKEMEDFFACTLVVQNASEISNAYKLIRENFEIEYQRPQSSSFTHKKAESFPFDDLRIYCKLKKNPDLPESILTSITFELQVKTFLQHAWSIATHDLVYKTDDANWSQERIAYQIKAMLEHAEVSIQQASTLADCDSLKKNTVETKKTKQAIKIIKQNWSDEELPKDKRRLAQNIISLCESLEVKISDLEKILKEQKDQRGNHLSNTSPYATIVQYLFLTEEEKFTSYLYSNESRNKVIISREIELPENFDKSRAVNAIML